MLMLKKLFKRKYIYGLRRLGSDRYVYVGQSNDPEKRLLSHIKQAKAGTHSNKRLALWIMGIIHCQCSMVIYDILEEVPEWKANDRELYWINFYNSGGPKMFNIGDPTTPYGRV
jgi:hypothetical protein